MLKSKYVLRSTYDLDSIQSHNMLLIKIASEKVLPLPYMPPHQLKSRNLDTVAGGVIIRVERTCAVRALDAGYGRVVPNCFPQGILHT